MKTNVEIFAKIQSQMAFELYFNGANSAEYKTLRDLVRSLIDDDDEFLDFIKRAESESMNF